MASKGQQQLNFPVRKSSRQSKPSRILQEAKEQTNSPKLQEQSEKSSRRENTPHGRSAGARTKQCECDSSSSKECTPQNVKARGKSPQGDISSRESTPQRTLSARRLFEADTSQRRGGTPQSSSRGERTPRPRRLFEADTSQRDCTPQSSSRRQRTDGARRLFEGDTSQRRDGTPQSSSRGEKTPRARRLFEADTSEKRDCTSQSSFRRERTDSARRLFEADTSQRRDGTPQSSSRGEKTPRARQLFEADTSEKRDYTPQSSSRREITLSARRLFEADTSQRDGTPQRSESARRTLELQCSPSKGDNTPVRVCRVSQNRADVSSVGKSPSKRKAASVESPSTPRKSPCKSPGGSYVHKTLLRCPSPEIYSEESDSEEEGGPSTPRLFVRPHNVSGDTTAPSEIVHVQAAAAVHSSATSAKRAQTAVQNAESIADQRHPSTPTKATQHSLSPKKGATQPPGRPHSLLLSAGSDSTPREVPSPFKAPTATPQKVQPQEKVLRPWKKGVCTPQKGQSHRMLSPRKTGPSLPQKLLSEKKVLSPKKVAGSSRRSLSSPDKKLASLAKGLTPGDEENFTLKSPKLLTKLQLGKQDNSGYQRAKQSLHTAKPSHLVGREEEVKEISDFLRSHLEDSSAGSLYISGAPGTGKTAALLHIIDEFKSQYTCHMAYVNCMMVKEVSSVFRRLYSELSGKPATGRTSVRDMENLVTTGETSMILILDEIDQLDSKNQEVLYTIFEWPSLLHSKLILIGVANALDLTDRILPRLQAKPCCRPTLLHFAPYTRHQITAVIQDRLLQSGETIMENSAIQFCARKVAAVAGDMRKALDVCRRAVELAESDTGSQTILRVSDCNSPRKQQAEARKVGVAHVGRVMEEVYGSSVQRQQGEGVPLQQKLVVCSLLLMLHTAKMKEVSMGKLHETYCKVCRRQQMSPVDQSEFHSLCVLLEARGVLGLKKARETRLMKVTLRQDQKELEQTLKDKVLVSAILADGLPK